MNINQLRNSRAMFNNIKTRVVYALLFALISLCSFLFNGTNVNATTNNINPTGLTSFLDKTALWVGLSEEQQTIFSQTDNIFYDPTECDEQGGNSDVNIDLSNLPPETIKRLESDKVKEKAEKNLKAYEAGANAEGIPWQMLAAIHYREGGMDPNKSIADGEPLGTGTSVDGQKIGNTLEEDAKIAAKNTIEL